MFAFIKPDYLSNIKIEQEENGTFYIVKTSGVKIEFPIEEQGLSKFGLLCNRFKGKARVCKGLTREII